MTRIALAAAAGAAALALTALTSAANAASFNCYGGLSYTEAAVCDNQWLSHLDTVMADKYFTKLNERYGWRREQLRNQQINWLYSRNDCAANVQCLTQKYNSRIWQLESTY